MSSIFRMSRTHSVASETAEVWTRSGTSTAKSSQPHAPFALCHQDQRGPALAEAPRRFEADRGVASRHEGDAAVQRHAAVRSDRRLPCRVSF